jgi:hypothetical protein
MSLTLNRTEYIVGKPNFQTKVLSRNQSAGDIVSALLVATRYSLPGAKRIAGKFKRSTPEKTALAVYDWMRKNYIYKRENADSQTAKTLQRIIWDSKNGTTGDCKHNSTTAAAIFKALDMPVHFRVIDQIGRYNHIYVVLKYANGYEIVVDGTSPYFNRESSYNKKTDIPV